MKWKKHDATKNYTIANAFLAHVIHGLGKQSGKKGAHIYTQVLEYYDTCPCSHGIIRQPVAPKGLVAFEGSQNYLPIHIYITTVTVVPLLLIHSKSASHFTSGFPSISQQSEYLLTSV